MVGGEDKRTEVEGMGKGLGSLLGSLLLGTEGGMGLHIQGAVVDGLQAVAMDRLQAAAMTAYLVLHPSRGSSALAPWVLYLFYPFCPHLCLGICGQAMRKAQYDFYV